MSDNDLETSMFGTQLTGPETDSQSLERQLSLYQQHLAELPATATGIDRARVQLDIAETFLALDRKEQTWSTAREALMVFINHEQWQEAV